MQYWHMLSARFDGLSLRERQLVIAGMLVFLYLVLDSFWLSPAAAEAKVLDKQLVQLNQQREQLDKALAAQTALLAPESLTAKRQQLVASERELDALDERLGQLSQGLVAVDDLPALLRDALAGADQLTLISLATLPVAELNLKPVQRTDEAGDLTTGLYKHSVRITLAGNYFSVLDYLQKLEALPWRFYWQALNYKVDEYPRAEIELEVYTLTAEEGRFGV